MFVRWPEESEGRHRVPGAWRELETPEKEPFSRSLSLEGNTTTPSMQSSSPVLLGLLPRTPIGHSQQEAAQKGTPLGQPMTTASCVESGSR